MILGSNPFLSTGNGHQESQIKNIFFNLPIYRVREGIAEYHFGFESFWYVRVIS
jgi:hypothetical protein